MKCTRCGIWELAKGDLVCAWCGTSYLSYTISLVPATLASEDYPPPLELLVRNASPLAAITLQRIESDAAWITLLPSQTLPQAVAPGAGYRLYLDVDTFAAGLQRQATVSVFALHASDPQTVTLHLQPSAS